MPLQSSGPRRHFRLSCFHSWETRCPAPKSIKTSRAEFCNHSNADDISPIKSRSSAYNRCGISCDSRREMSKVSCHGNAEHVWIHRLSRAQSRGLLGYLIDGYRVIDIWSTMLGFKLKCPMFCTDLGKKHRFVLPWSWVMVDGSYAVPVSPSSLLQ